MNRMSPVLEGQGFVHVATVKQFDDRIVLHLYEVVEPEAHP